MSGHSTSPSCVSNATGSINGAVSSCELDNTIIEFRTIERTYTGEFGFDWLRVNENVTNMNLEFPYIDLKDPTSNTIISHGVIEGGYHEPTDWNDSEAKSMQVNDRNDLVGAVVRELKYGGAGEYQAFKIGRNSTRNRHTTYFIPYLNLFPESYPFKVVSYNTIIGSQDTLPPPSKVSLRLIKDIKNKVPERITIECDTSLFKIEGDSIIPRKKGKSIEHYVLKPASYKGITNDDVTTSTEVIKGEIAITCLKAFSADQEINVYAHYPDNNEKKLAGSLIVCANAVIKKVRIVLVRVKTDLSPSDMPNPKIGNFCHDHTCNEEIDYLFKALHQALIVPELIMQYADGTDIKLDVSQSSLFHKQFWNIGSVVRQDGKDYYINAEDNQDIIKKLMGLFLTDPKNEKYRDDFIVFSFDEKCHKSTDYAPNKLITGFANHETITSDSWFNKILGYREEVEFMGPVCVFLRDQTTLAHEVLHGLGLPHTFRDTSQFFKQQKYVYAQYVTTNFMDYFKYGFPSKYTTLHWQWRVLQNSKYAK